MARNHFLTNFPPTTLKTFPKFFTLRPPFCPLNQTKYLAFHFIFSFPPFSFPPFPPLRVQPFLHYVLLPTTPQLGEQSSFVFFQLFSMPCLFLLSFSFMLFSFFYFYFSPPPPPARVLLTTAQQAAALLAVQGSG
jgi:hypothetical protein